MRKSLRTVMIATVLIAVMIPAAYAKDEFEKGFKTELGAIAAQSAVGLGVSVVNGVLAGGGVYYGGYYGPPVVVHQSCPPPYYVKRVIYAPPPRPYYRVQRRVCDYCPTPRCYHPAKHHPRKYYGY